MDKIKKLESYNFNGVELIKVNDGEYVKHDDAIEIINGLVDELKKTEARLGYIEACADGDMGKVQALVDENERLKSENQVLRDLKIELAKDKSATIREIAAMQAEADRHQWIPVSERLPDFDIPVLAYQNNGIYPAMRVWEADGWLWHVSCSYARDILDRLDYECDDDYKFTHWKELDKPE